MLCPVCGHVLKSNYEHTIGLYENYACPNCRNIVDSPEDDLNKSASAFNTQVGGNHYKQYAIQPYEFFFRNKIPHHKAAIIRRILRYDHETGMGLADLEKIEHEIKLIKELEYNAWFSD
jgi:hypothetical protein